MKFAFALLPIAAALGFVEAGPVTAEGHTKHAPADVVRLDCDRDSYTCTASLNYDNGIWVARWRAEIHHLGLLGFATDEQTSSILPAPWPVSNLACDGSTSMCTANLRLGGEPWIAQWNTRVIHWALFGQEFDGAIAPVRRLTCDGDSSTCTANLAYGDGYWIAEWDVYFSRF